MMVRDKTQMYYRFTAWAQMEEGVFPIVESAPILSSTYEDAEKRFIDSFMADEILVEDVEDYGSVSVTVEEDDHYYWVD